MPSNPQTIYVPPTQSETLNLSREVCAALASRTGDSSFADQDVVFGLSDFLRSCGSLLADQLNRPEVPLAAD